MAPPADLGTAASSGGGGGGQERGVEERERGGHARQVDFHSPGNNVKEPYLPPAPPPSLGHFSCIFLFHR